MRFITIPSAFVPSVATSFHSELGRLWLLAQGRATCAATQALGRTTPLSTAKGTAAQQQQHQQRNTMTKYFPVLQDGTGSRGSEQLQSGQPTRERTEASCMPRTAEAACQTEADESAAALAKAQALQAELDRLRDEADQLRCFVPAAACGTEASSQAVCSIYVDVLRGVTCHQYPSHHG